MGHLIATLQCRAGWKTCTEISVLQTFQIFNKFLLILDWGFRIFAETIKIPGNFYKLFRSSFQSICKANILARIGKVCYREIDLAKTEITSPPSAQVAAMSAMQHETFYTLNLFLKLHWNSFENSRNTI